MDEQIRVIKLLSPSFTLDNLYDELAVIAIIRVFPHSFDDVVRTISVLDMFDQQSVIPISQEHGSNLLQSLWHFICILSIIHHLRAKSCPRVPSTSPHIPSTPNSQFSTPGRPTYFCSRLGTNTTSHHPPQLPLPPHHLRTSPAFPSPPLLH